MAVPKSKPYIDIADYYRAEAAAPQKHEYFAGEIFAMAGGSIQHGAIGHNLHVALGTRLRNGRCRGLSSDVRVRVMATGLTTYPDASVVCGDIETDPADAARSTVTNPTVLFEVLSPTTEAYDRGAKFANYQRIESLREYVLISQDRPFVECFRRRDGGRWEYVSFDGPAATAVVEALSVQLPLAELYDRIEFAPPVPPPDEARSSR
jgi:Uma2 family endonuclease